MWKVLLIDECADGRYAAISEALTGAGYAVEVQPVRKVTDFEPANWSAVVVPVSTPADFDLVTLFSGFPREWALVLLVETQDPTVWERAAREGAEALVDGRAGIRQVTAAVASGLRLRAEANLRILPLERSCLCPVEMGAGETQRFARSLGRILQARGHVTIEAEEGCGGEMLARWLHTVRRHTGPFHSLDCASVDDEVIHSMVLGSAQWGPGCLELSCGGTLLLRNPQHLPAGTQAALGLCLRNGEFMRPGTAEKVTVDLDIVTLGSVNLADLVAEGLFNRNLAVVLGEEQIPLPPLRERHEEVPQLAAAWASRAGRRCSLAPATIKLFREYHWPGNGWELLTTLEEAYGKVGQGGIIQPVHMPGPVRKSRTSMQEEEDNLYTLPRLNSGQLPELRTFREQARIQAERVYLLRVMEQAGGKVAQARQLAGLSKSSFYALLGKHSLLPDK